MAERLKPLFGVAERGVREAPLTGRDAELRRVTDRLTGSEPAAL
jgi:hypothetical protein